MGGETKHIRGLRSRTLIPRDNLYNLHITKYWAKYKNIEPLGIANFLNTALHYYFSLKMFENFGLTQDVEIDFKEASNSSVATVLQSKYGNVVNVNWFTKIDDNNKMPNRLNFSAFNYLEQFRKADLEDIEENSKETYTVNGNDIEVKINFGIYEIENVEYKVELENVNGDILAKIEEDDLGYKVKLVKKDDETVVRYEYFTFVDESIYIVSYDDKNENEHFVYLYASEAEQTVLKEKTMILTIKKDKNFVYNNRYKKILLHKYGLLSKGRNEKSLVESLANEDIKDAFLTFAYPCTMVREDEDGNTCNKNPKHYDIYISASQMYKKKGRVLINGNQINIIYDYDEPNIELDGTAYSDDGYCINVNGTKAPLCIFYTEHPKVCDYSEKLLIYPLSIIKKKSIRDKFRYLEFGFQIILTIDKEVKLEWWQTGVFGIIIDLFEIAIGLITQNYYLVTSGIAGLLGDTGIIDKEFSNILQITIGIIAIDFSNFGLYDATKLANYGTNLYNQYIQEQIQETQKKMQDVEYEREKEERELETYKNRLDLPILSYNAFDSQYMLYDFAYSQYGKSYMDFGYKNFGYN